MKKKINNKPKKTVENWHALFERNEVYTYYESFLQHLLQIKKNGFYDMEKCNYSDYDYSFKFFVYDNDLVARMKVETSIGNVTIIELDYGSLFKTMKTSIEYCGTWKEVNLKSHELVKQIDTVFRDIHKEHKNHKKQEKKKTVGELLQRHEEYKMGR